ncbi:hypothetical protein NC661_09775 [Aquibacillus koreensis]|uniref:Uncharacterized protein n=1 Tax=Aquibacillus koreensis TaxID=279446 RepID=A0A9X4AI65_9BACI|nr:hypothetical protein [Aquibacillus koreensis]MCT2534335.1 hypothetical protein [Aquibacillus koreensis]MDC3420656.1 hypothetical protein [Aquibacillus koreensis]
MYIGTGNEPNEGVLGLVKVSQLVPFGITENHLFFIVGLLGVVVCYYLLYPILNLLVLLKWSSLLTYIFGGLFFLIIIGLYTILQHAHYLGSIDISKLGNVVLGITFFGAVLFIIQVCQSILTYIRKQKSNSI